MPYVAPQTLPTHPRVTCHRKFTFGGHIGHPVATGRPLAATISQNVLNGRPGTPVGVLLGPETWVRYGQRPLRTWGTSPSARETYYDNIYTSWNVKMCIFPVHYLQFGRIPYVVTDTLSRRDGTILVK